MERELTRLGVVFIDESGDLGRYDLAIRVFIKEQPSIAAVIRKRYIVGKTTIYRIFKAIIRRFEP